MPRHSLVVTGLLSTVVLLAGRELLLAPTGGLTVHFFDVSQGDSALLVSPSGKQILIDGGPDMSALEGLGGAMPFFDRSIELLVLSHPNTDHFASFLEVLRRYSVRAVLMTGVAFDLPRYEGFLTLLHERNVPILLADPAKDIDLGDGLVLDVLWPPPAFFGRYAKEVNDTSIVLRAVYKDHEVLFTGDTEGPAENAILRSNADLRADILKVAHHGSKTSSTLDFLRAVQPSLAVISVGKDNRYGHPHREVMERFARLGIPVRTTAKEGNITIVFE